MVIRTLPKFAVDEWRYRSIAREGYLFRSGTRNRLCFQNVSACAARTIAL